MPTDTSDQQITMPVDADAADNPVAFANAVADIESRLVLRYVDEADRTTRHPAPVEGQISYLQTENRTDLYAPDWISLYTRSFYSMLRKGADQTLSSNTSLTNDTALVAALPISQTFGFRLNLFYDGPDAGDIKFAIAAPAGATGVCGVQAISTAGVAGVGTGQYSATAALGTAIACGTTGAGNRLLALIEGEVTMGATAGNLQLQWAQNTPDAGTTAVRARSRMFVWRIL